MIKIGDYFIQDYCPEEYSFNTYIIKIVSKYGMFYECEIWCNGTHIGMVMEGEDRLLKCRKMSKIEKMLLT